MNSKNKIKKLAQKYIHDCHDSILYATYDQGRNFIITLEHGSYIFYVKLYDKSGKNVRKEITNTLPEALSLYVSLTSFFKFTYRNKKIFSLQLKEFTYKKEDKQDGTI